MSQIIKSAVGSSPGNPISFVTDNGTAAPVANILNVLGGLGIQTTGVGNTITIKVINDGFTWSEQVASFSAQVQNGYFCNNPLTVTLPASGGLVLGNTIIIYNDSTGSVIIQAGVGESIQFADVATAPGGILTSLTKGDSVELVFKPSDLTWHNIASNGNWV